MPDPAARRVRGTWLTSLARGVFGLVLLGVGLWTLGALLVLGPDWLAAIYLVSVPLLLLLPETRRQAVAVSIGMFLVALVLFFSLRPSNERDWEPSDARTPWAEIDGDRVTIHDVRNARWRTAEDYDVTWETRSYDLRDLDRIDFFIVPFQDLPGGAHTFVSFGFRGGEHLAISVETRKERGESYGILAGLYRQLELLYVIADERDVVGVRTHVRGDTVRVYPMRSTPEGRRAFLVDMLETANQLHREPAFYNSVTRTCTSSLVDHLDRVRDTPIGFSIQTILPGLSDRKAFALGLVDTDLDLAEARRRFRIDPNRTSPDAPDFSEAIRRGRDADAR